jgi:hypothetical protein
MKNPIILIAVILNILAIGLSGCIINGEGKGVLMLQITDAPPEIKITKALINISNIEVHLIATGWYTVIGEEQTFDLIQLQNVKKALGNKTLPVGRYTQIRLIIDDALVTIDGIEYKLTIPSKTIHLISPFSINKNETTTLTIDFDVHKSVHETGNGKYIMKPTIKIIQE